MAKESTSKPKTGNATKIEHGRNGGTKFTTTTQTKSGSKQVIYNQPPKKK